MRSFSEAVAFSPRILASGTLCAFLIEQNRAFGESVDYGQEVRSMSVLSDLVYERQEWVHQYGTLIRRHHHLRIVTNYALLITVGLLLHFFHERILILIRSILSY